MQRLQETRLIYLRARDLNPTLGRFLSADTVRPNAPGSQGYNLYAYVANNPTSWVDPSGHSTIADTLAQLPRLSADGALLATSLAGLIKLTLTIGRNAASWAFGQQRNTSILVLGVMGFVLACGLIEGCMASANTYGNLVNQAGSLATAGVLTWGLTQLQEADALYPRLPTVIHPPAITRPAGTLNGPLRPFWETCMLSAVVSGLADLTSSAFGYQNNATTNAGLAANAMYNVATCGGGGGSSGDRCGNTSKQYGHHSSHLQL